MGFHELKDLIEQHPQLADFERGVSGEEIQACESRLAVKLPASYVEFLRAYGVGNFASEEFFGLGIPATAMPSMLWYTEATRRDERNFPDSYVAIYDAGLGEILCLATDRMDANGECPVIAWVMGAPTQYSEVVAATFADFALDLVKRELGRRA